MRTLLILISLLLYNLAWAQIPVTDAATNANIAIVNSNLGVLTSNLATTNTTLAEILSIQTTAKGEAAQTTTNTMNTLDEAKKMREIIEQVNSAVSNAMIVKEIWDNAEKLTTTTFNMQRVLNHASKKYKWDRRNTINQATDILQKMQPVLELVNKVLSSGVLKADDTQRLQMLMELNKQIKALVREQEVLAYHAIELPGLSYDVIKN